MPIQVSHDLSEDNIKYHFQTAVITSCKTSQQLYKGKRQKKTTGHEAHQHFQKGSRASYFRPLFMDFSPCVAWKIH